MKRLFDLMVATTVLTLALPLMVGIALAIRFKLGAPVLFKQTRPGQDGQPFELVKFRTMIEGEASDAERLTPFGRFLRSTSLDELPELWNVFRGEMSLVGPRPLLIEYLPLYTAQQARRHDVRPGITGLAQVRGRNLLEWQDRFDLDVWYVDHRSMRLDIKILMETVGAVVTARGVSAEDHVTVDPFAGAPTLPKARADR